MSSNIQREERVLTSILPNSQTPHHLCAMERGWVIGWKIMGLRDFQQHCSNSLTLGFKVRVHSNLKVSTLTLKDQFFKNRYCSHYLNLRCQQIVQSLNICHKWTFTKVAFNTHLKLVFNSLAFEFFNLVFKYSNLVFEWLILGSLKAWS